MTDIQKERVERQGNLIYGHFSLSKYLPHNHYLQFAFGHFKRNGSITNAPLFFHESVEISLFTSLYNHPIELSPSPRGPNPLKAGYLSFQ